MIPTVFNNYLIEKESDLFK